MYNFNIPDIRAENFKYASFEQMSLLVGKSGFGKLACKMIHIIIVIAICHNAHIFDIPYQWPEIFKYGNYEMAGNFQIREL
ncbi:hypothetical protein ED312_03770 [Sinomicrobium pectinilyticum]|uniref:Uncharacterized protein n=1 Tax=Sinomicrobium pectinilyticum TaxID=1084421 RepID=A0A3N0EWL4_SINP1|nr:hypothetical protein ED312_03770 [Sinomicrobium pectinilyticum]